MSASDAPVSRECYAALADTALDGGLRDAALCARLLADPSIELMPLLNAAYEVRQAYHGRDVTLHIINNAQNGLCPEDCHYCAQAKSASADIAEYRLKPDEEIFEEARLAYEGGAHRYCMVFAGRGPSRQRVEKLASLVSTIKSRWPIEVCVSPGLLDEEGARALKAAGLDRLNHNLNTSESHYPKICSSHSFADRVRTLQAAQSAGLEMCSGVIIGMGESATDVVDVALRLAQFGAASIPVNFLMEIDGTQLAADGALEGVPPLTPEYCLRVLALYRLVNPRAEIRAAAGREMHLRRLEVLSLYAANSIFVDGYLNTRGSSRADTLQMIRDAGFTIKSDHDLDALIAAESAAEATPAPAADAPPMKTESDLRPATSRA